MTDKKRKSFVLHIDVLSVLDDLTDEQAGKLFKAIKANRTNEEVELDAITKIALNPFKAQFARDDEKYQNIVDRNKNNGSKGGRPKKQEEPKKPTGLNGNPNKPQKADSDSDSDSDSDNKDNTIVLVDESPSTPPYESIASLYNEVFPMLPACKSLNDERKKRIRSIWRTELQTIEDWANYFNYVKSNCTWVMKPKLGGAQNAIDWFLKSRNLTATKEGSYDDRN
jgi:hypothetical protein